MCQALEFCRAFELATVSSMADLFGEQEAEQGHSKFCLSVNKEYAKRFKVGDMTAASGGWTGLHSI